MSTDPLVFPISLKRPGYLGYPSYGLKLLRALDHFGDLYSSCHGFAESSPYMISSHRNVDSSGDETEYVAKVTLRAQPPINISVLLSDCIHNLRQSLDHLAFEIAAFVSGENPPPNEGTAGFPIHNSSGAFKGKLKAKIGDPETIPQPLLKLLKELQPYNSDIGKRLAALRDMDDSGKHRQLPVCVGIVKSGTLSVNGVAVETLDSGPLEIGETEIGRFKSSQSEVKMEGTFRIDIVFGDGPAAGEPILEYIEATRNIVAQGVVAPIEALLYPAK